MGLIPKFAQKESKGTGGNQGGKGPPGQGISPPACICGGMVESKEVSRVKNLVSLWEKKGGTVLGGGKKKESFLRRCERK